MMHMTKLITICIVIMLGQYGKYSTNIILHHIQILKAISEIYCMVMAY